MPEPAPRRAGGPARARALLRRCWPPALIMLAGLGLWELIVALAHVPGYLLPAPSAIAADLATDWPVLEPASLVTLQEVLLGFVIAAAAGVGLATALHLSPVARRAVYPLLIGSQTVPIIVLAPILVILLGYGMAPKLVIVALICFFPIVVNGIDGLRSVDAELIRMMRTLDASRWAILRRVEFPAALPSIFSGLRIAATFAAIGAVFGEWSGSNQGLGYVMLAATPNLLTARIFAAIVLLTAIALLLFGAVSLLERIFVPWAPRGERERSDPR
ncbi:MAG TPA: ABC transporter permease [Streptosporangiaceae bacterium]|nr:ABC transporter permease [Streptosporangiaceae bacterium]